jgi:hypothetical protein
MGLHATQSVFILVSLAFADLASAENRISGTYVSHGGNFTEMLQLTQTENGHLVGVMTSVTLSAEGSVTSKNGQLTGATDAGQITLLCHYGLLDDVNLAGTVNWTKSEIQFQWSGADGTVATAVFARGAASDFKTYTDQLKFKANSIVLTKELLSHAEGLGHAIQQAAAWISNAKLHEQRIPKAKEYYQKLEDQMRSLVSRERRASDPDSRSAIGIDVRQSDEAGDQTDIEIDYLWDTTIGNDGKSIADAFANGPLSCEVTNEYLKRGAEQQVVENWKTACQQALAERDKFGPIFKRIMEQRADLKSYQSAMRTRRKVLVQEADELRER